MVYRIFFSLSFLFFSTSFDHPAIASSISGNQLKKIVIDELYSKGVQSDPVINEKRIFAGCAEEHIRVGRRDISWNTLKVSCKKNDAWNFNFRNKIYSKNNIERDPNMEGKAGFYDKKIQTKYQNDRKFVFVLTNSKERDDILDNEDLKLELRKKILSNDSFSDKNLILGRKLSKSLKKGAILKGKHLKQDWLVHKNQKIEIENQVGAVKVSMQGIALSDGLKGDRILVKNLSSNKTVEGFVKSEKKISIFRKIN